MPGLAVVPTRGPEQLRLFDGGIDLAGLRRERAELAASTRSASTVKGYAAAWRSFLRFCTDAGRDALPCSSDTLSLYVVDQARAALRPATIAQRVAGVVDRHTAAGFASPVDDDVREVMAGVRRRLGTASTRAKAAISVEELRAMLGAVDGKARRGVYEWELAGAAARVARDRAMLLVGFASGLRSAELVGLDLADVSIEDAGLVLRLVRSKTDQEGRGREVAVNRGRRRGTCPVRALDLWLVERGPWAGPLFCRIGAGGSVTHKRLGPQAVCVLVQASARRAGLDAKRFGSHSLRAGFATCAAERGASDRAIMSRTGHKSAAMVGRYIRHGTLFGVNPLDGAL